MNTQILNINECSSYRNCTLAYGHFSSIHPGHIRYLKYAKTQGKILIVAIRGDFKNKFKFNQKERAEGLSLLGLVDGIILMKEEEFNLKDLIGLIQPSLLILGKEYENNATVEVSEAIKTQKLEGRLIKYHAGDVQYANTELLSTTGKDLKEKRKNQFRLACAKHKIHLESLIQSIKRWEASKIIVIGKIVISAVIFILTLRRAQSIKIQSEI